MTKLQIMFFLQTFILSRKDDFKPYVLKAFELNVEDVLKSCCHYEDTLRRIEIFSRYQNDFCGCLYRDFVHYLRSIEKICYYY